jgi:hypothetical protein
LCAHFIAANLQRFALEFDANAGLAILTDMDNSEDAAKSWSFPDRRNQPAASAGEPRHHGANRHFSRLSDLAVVKAFDVTQH